MVSMANDTQRLGRYRAWRMRHRKQFIFGSALGY